jgi:anaerobic selenocysteine-containing dehydrogenase
MEQIKTTCPRDCYDACGMLVSIDNGEIVSIKGERQHPITQGFLCPRGVKDIDRLKTRRIDNPYIRIGGVLQKTDWNNALKIFTQKIKSTIKNFGADKILYVDYAGNEGLFNNIFARRLWYALGASFTDGALCTTTGHKAINLHYGKAYGVQPTELSEKKLIVFWAFNPAVTAPHFWKLALEARKKNAAKIIVIDVLRTKSAKNADLFIQISPFTDTALAYSLINKIIEQKAYDADFIKKYTLGFEKFSEEAKKWTLEKTAKFCKIKQKDIEYLARLYAKNKKSATLIGVGLQKNNDGSEAIRTVSLLPAVLGIHRGFFYSNSPALSVDLDYIQAKHLKNNNQIISQIELANEIINKKIRLLYVNSTNPLVTHPNTQKLKEIFCSSDVFTVVNETHWSETAKRADLVLPVPTFLEKDDVMLSWGHNYTRYSQKAIDPITNSKPEYEIMQILARNLGFDPQSEIFDNPRDVVQKAFENAISVGKIFDEKNEIVELKILPKNQYQTPSGKIEFFSSQASRCNINPLPQQPDVPKLYSDEFFLFTTAVAKYTNSQFKEVYGQIPPHIFINPDDAEYLKISDSQKVIITNKIAKLIFYAKIDDTVPRKVLWTPRTSTDKFGNQINNIINNQKNSFGHGPTFHSTIVKILPTK